MRKYRYYFVWKEVVPEQTIVGNNAIGVFLAAIKHWTPKWFKENPQECWDKMCEDGEIREIDTDRVVTIPKTFKKVTHMKAYFR